MAKSKGHDLAKREAQSVEVVRTVLAREDVQRAVTAALGEVMPLNRFVALIESVARRTPDLLKCHPLSICGAVVRIAGMGLDPNPELQLVHLVPFWNKKTGCHEAQVIPGYKGAVTLAMQHPEVASVHARVVQADDEFDYELGTEESVRHKIAKTPQDPGDYRAAYAIVRFRDGSKRVEVLERWELDRIAKVGGPVWKSHPDRMACKSALLRIFKQLPVSTEMTRRVSQMAELDERANAGISQGLGMLDGLPWDESTPQTAEGRLEQAVKDSGALFDESAEAWDGESELSVE